MVGRKGAVQPSDIINSVLKFKERVVLKNEKNEFVNQLQQKIHHERILSAKCLEKQAKKMVKTSDSKYPELEVGTSMRISIPDFDRARGSPRNILAGITDVKDDLYELCTENGFLKHKYIRTEINPCKEKLLPIDVLVVHLLDYVILSVIIVYHVTIKIKIIIYSKNLISIIIIKIKIINNSK